MSSRLVAIKQRRRRVPIAASVPVEASAAPAPESSLPVIVEESSEETLTAQLRDANAEIARLKAVLTAAVTGKGIVINYPMPAMNGAALLEPEKYEYVKQLYSGVLLELLATTHRGLESNNRKAYGFYDINTEKQEVTMTLVETQGL